MELLKVCGTGMREKNEKVKMRAQAPATTHGLAIDWPSKCQSTEPITFVKHNLIPPICFIQFTINAQNSIPTVNQTHLYMTLLT